MKATRRATVLSEGELKAQAWLPATLAVALAAPSASAQPALRVEVEQKGDFVLIGNTLAHECNNAVTPVIGVVSSCGMNTADTAPDIFWRADSPGPGQAVANDGITPAAARSSASLSIPAGATITHAFLYWATTLPTAGQDVNVTLDREGGFATNVAATAQNGVYQSFGDLFAYHAVADVTPIVQSNGIGSYRVSLANVEDLRNLDATAGFAGWWMVVFYQHSNASPRSLALFDSFVQISPMNSPESATISAFLVPSADFTGKLGVVAFGGDESVTGDSISFDGNVLGDPLNPPYNFVNATRSSLGKPVSAPGDLPRLTGGPRSMSGMDMDVMDITSMLMPGATSATVDVGSTQDEYFLAGLVTSIPTTLERPDFATSTKTARDVNDAPLFPGDTIEYTIIVTNTGNDTSTDTVLIDPLPAGVTYMQGSLAVAAGPKAASKTDAAGDDQGEFDFEAQTIIVRLGDGADDEMGGTLPVGQSTTVTFQVIVNSDFSGVILNQAIIHGGGMMGAPRFDTTTDGNGSTDGRPPTKSVVESSYFDYTGCLCELHRSADSRVKSWPAAVVMAAAWLRRRRRGPRLTGATL